MTVNGGPQPGPGFGLVEQVMDALVGVAPDGLPTALAAAAGAAGFTDATIYLADLQQTLLTPWPPSGHQPEGVDDTLAGRAFRRETSVYAEDVGWFPLSDGGDRLGVLRLAHPGIEVGEGVPEAGARLAALIALLITSRRLRTDTIANAARTRPVTLAAEARWSLLPPRTLVAPQLCISGHLEPAYEIAGDSYDYALNGDLLDVAVLDAMGHGLAASRLANLAVVSYRHARRNGAELPDIYRNIDEAILAEFGGESFVTAHLARLNISSGVLSVVNAGHPPPLLIRNGAAHSLRFAPATPIGLGFATAEIGETRLEPGDVILIISDGVTEAHSAGGDLFGADRVGDLAARAIGDGESIPEAVRRLVISLLGHRSVGLEDDASFVMLAWRPGSV